MIFIEGCVMLEIKALEKLGGVHKAQAIKYCKAYNIEDGLIINFGENSLKFIRLSNKKYKSTKSNQSQES